MGTKTERFTADGSEGLEQRLRRTCGQVLESVQRSIPAGKLQALVLGGGYGRGEGGVLRTEFGDEPYNDLEFYVFLRSSRLTNELLYRKSLDQCAHALTSDAGLHVELKIESLHRFETEPISMFSYDLVSGHRIVFGEPALFHNCEQHRIAADIPLTEASRLLLNRGTGLLLAREQLLGSPTTPAETDFVGRNVAKAKLGMGDAFLNVLGQYHWSCLERRNRLEAMGSEPKALLLLSTCGRRTQCPAWFESVVRLHGEGCAFKLHPRKAAGPAAELAAELSDISALFLHVWRWVEDLRIGRCATDVENPALGRTSQPARQPIWKNYLLNLRTFGLRAALQHQSWRYPRERLFNTFPLLLEFSRRPEIVRFIQRQLRTFASDWPELLAAYKAIWVNYG